MSDLTSFETIANELNKSLAPDELPLTAKDAEEICNTALNKIRLQLIEGREETWRYKDGRVKDVVVVERLNPLGLALSGRLDDLMAESRTPGRISGSVFNRLTFDEGLVDTSAQQQGDDAASQETQPESVS